MRFFRPIPACGALLVWAVLLPWSPAQTDTILTIAPPGKVLATTGETATASIQVRLRPGYHINSHTPSDEYLIPLRLQWKGEPLEVAEISFPEPQMESYSFADKPLSVFTGDFEVTSRFRVPKDAPAGSRVLTGTLRYQACTDKLCFPPKTVTVRLPVDIR